MRYEPVFGDDVILTQDMPCPFGAPIIPVGTAGKVAGYLSGDELCLVDFSAPYGLRWCDPDRLNKISDRRAATIADLREVGEACFGPNWQNSLAREMKITKRAMRYILAGERDLPDKCGDILVEILRAHGERLDRIEFSLLCVK